MVELELLYAELRGRKLTVSALREQLLHEELMVRSVEVKIKGAGGKV